MVGKSKSVETGGLSMGFVVNTKSAAFLSFRMLTSACKNTTRFSSEVGTYICN